MQFLIKFVTPKLFVYNSSYAQSIIRINSEGERERRILGFQKSNVLPGLLWLTLNLALIIQCFSRNIIFKFYISPNRPPLLYSGQSSWLQVQRSGFDSQRYQVFWEVVGLERGPFSLVSTIEELLERKSRSSGLEMRLRPYGLSWLGDTTQSAKKLALTSPTSGGRSVGIVHSRTQVTEFSFFSFSHPLIYLCVPPGIGIPQVEDHWSKCKKEIWFCVYTPWIAEGRLTN
jgi:hypothetical protein